MVKVYAPVKTYGGTVGDLKFEEGVAEVPKDHASMGYFERAGYGIGKRPDKDVGVAADKLEPTVDGKPIDARDYTEPTWFGARLRDAAVDPRPDDFLAPTNAGDANPHGPMVVSPGIHGLSGPKPVLPGAVSSDADAQAAAETELAASVLVAGEPATSVGEEFDADENMGPLGMTDPGSVDAGPDAAAEPEADAKPAAKPKKKG